MTMVNKLFIAHNRTNINQDRHKSKLDNMDINNHPMHTLHVQAQKYFFLSEKHMYIIYT